MEIVRGQARIFPYFISSLSLSLLQHMQLFKQLLLDILLSLSQYLFFHARNTPDFLLSLLQYNFLGKKFSILHFHFQNITIQENILLFTFTISLFLHILHISLSPYHIFQIRQWFQRRVEELSARNFKKKESRRLVSLMPIFILLAIISSDRSSYSDKCSLK